MKLKDAEALKEIFKQRERWHFTGIIAAIDNAPSIDAVPVVRCKDCVNRYTDTCPAYQSIFGDMYDEDFCSDGTKGGE